METFLLKKNEFWIVIWKTLLTSELKVCILQTSKKKTLNQKEK